VTSVTSGGQANR